MHHEACTMQRPTRCGASCRGEQSPSAPRETVCALRLAHYGESCPVIGQGIKTNQVKKEEIRKVHVVLVQSAVDKLTRDELHAAKYGLEFSERSSHPVKPIVREVSPAPLRFSLASLLPAGV